jgi:hypothetical protein
VRLLLEAGADPTRSDAEGRTALDVAKGHLGSWISINQENPVIPGINEDPESTAARHREALKEAQESLRMMEEAVSKRRRGIPGP